MTLEAIVFTSMAEMTRKMGQVFMEERSDHLDIGMSVTDVIDDSINEATLDVDNYANMYSTASLSTNILIRRKTTTLACCHLSRTRGDPGANSLEDECERIIEWLEKISTGAIKLKGVAMSGDFRPAFSNRTIDRRYGQSKIRIQTAISSNIISKLKRNKATRYGPHH